jgi:orotidine-5'-phosphate decarboxylase
VGNPIIVALDLESADEARAIIKALGGSVSFYKVGLELYAAAGMDFVRELTGAGHKVFLDLKLYDIGETVKRAVRQIARTGVQLLTIHTPISVMNAAVEGRGDSSLQLLGVTVLTNFDQSDLVDRGCSAPVADLVADRVRKAVSAGVDGVVCSPLEAAMVRRVAGPEALIVTPGVRSAGSGHGDQKRVATPAQAIRDGANYLVIGRQITRAADPAAEARRILEEIK